MINDTVCDGDTLRGEACTGCSWDATSYFMRSICMGFHLPELWSFNCHLATSSKPSINKISQKINFSCKILGRGMCVLQIPPNLLHNTSLVYGSYQSVEGLDPLDSLKPEELHVRAERKSTSVIR